MLIKSALRDDLAVSYGIITILLTGSLRSPPPIRAAPDFPLFRGKNKTPRDNLLINPPLEMTVLAAPLSSFRPKRSGVEKSHASDGTGGITVGDLSTQRIIGAVPACPPYRHAAPLEMTILAGSIGHAFDMRVQRVQRVVISPSRAISFIGLPGRPTPSTTGVVPLPLQAGGGKFTGERSLSRLRARIYEGSSIECRRLFPYFPKREGGGLLL